MLPSYHYSVAERLVLRKQIEMEQQRINSKLTETTLSNGVSVDILDLSSDSSSNSSDE